MKPAEVRAPSAYRASWDGAFGKETADRAEALYSELVSSRPVPADARLRRHLHGHILPGLAVYRTLRERGLGEKAALEAVDGAFALMVEGLRGKYLALGRLPFFYSLFRVFMPLAMRAYPASGWDTKWLEVSGERIRFDIGRCYYHETLTELGASELTASFCRTDDLTYDGLSASYAWRRTTTLGRGGAKCDFCFERRRR